VREEWQEKRFNLKKMKEGKGKLLLKWVFKKEHCEEQIASFP
jgi:hypothetical protein